MCKKNKKNKGGYFPVIVKKKKKIQIKSPSCRCVSLWAVLCCFPEKQASVTTTMLLSRIPPSHFAPGWFQLCAPLPESSRRCCCCCHSSSHCQHSRSQPVPAGTFKLKATAWHIAIKQRCKKKKKKKKVPICHTWTNSRYHVKILLW